MERDTLLKIIFGAEYKEGCKWGEKVLDYIESHPDWRRGNDKLLYKNTILSALNNAIEDVFGHPLSYYDNNSRKREFVEVRQMAFYLYHELTGYHLREVGEIFHKHHSTVIFAYNQAKNLIETNKSFKRDYQLLEKRIKIYL